MARVSKHLLLLLLTATLCATASAWTPETRVRMADEAVAMMPASLRLALKPNLNELRRGVLKPLTSEDAPEHLAPWSGGRLPQQVEAAAEALREALHRTDFARVAERFGELAHYVQDAGFPPGVSRTDGELRYRHFSAFCESRRERFPLVFYGHDESALADGFRRFALDVIERASREDLQLERAYTAAGDPPNPAAFDDRSIPFAIASLSYSRTVTDITRAWLAVWKQAGGDMGRTPYLEESGGPDDDRGRP